MAKKIISLFGALLLCSDMAVSGVLDNAACIAPAKPGGGFDLTCQFLRDILYSSGESKSPIQIKYQPGGVGALAYESTIKHRENEKNTVVAFSSGTLLNLAQHRFGSRTIDDVSWVAIFGLDYGVVAVRRDAPYKDLKSLIDALKISSKSIYFGSGGTIGSQDWVKAAMIARQAGVNFKDIRVVAFEGGGDALNALQGGYIQVLAGDTAEASKYLGKNSKIRILAVLSEKRLPGIWENIPTALEQGFDIQWKAYRGIYMSSAVDDSTRSEWTAAVNRAMKHKSFTGISQNSGFQPTHVTGPELDGLIKKQVYDYRKIINDFGLMVDR